MKLSVALSITLIGLSASQVMGACSAVTFANSCTKANVQLALAESGCTQAELDIIDPLIEGQCLSANNRLVSELFLPWDKITMRGAQFDDTFFDGGGIFNTEDGIAVTKLTVAEHQDTQRLLDIKQNILDTGGIGWPQGIANFDIGTSCAAQAAMCCWTASRNTDSMKIEDAEKNPNANADVCSHEIKNAPKSAHVEDGTVIYPSTDARDNAQCHGFFWDDSTDKYKGNLLFKVAMSEGLLGNGHVRNIPGAPMCACIEQMPVVSNAGYTALSKVVETWKVSYDTDLQKLSITPEGDAVLTFESGDDIVEGYRSSTNGFEDKAEISDYVVGSCDNNVKAALEDHAFKARPADQKWVPVTGRGIIYQPEVSNFTEIWAASETQILRRKCFECDLTHVDIFYRRFDTNGLPEGFDLLDTVKSHWAESDNNRNLETFKLYSTYADAIANENHWTYCNYASNVGFPRDCGPIGYTPSQWNRYEPANGAKYHVAFYVDHTPLPA